MVGGRVEQRVLHLGDRGQRDFGRKHVVEHMIVAQISVGEHIIADRLARPKPAAMADHQPHVGAQHRDMVADRLSVGRADADVDQRDPGAAFGNQVIGGHLLAPPLAGGDLRLGVVEFAALVDRARDRQRGKARVLASKAVDRDGDELVDVAHIVGEQHEALEMLRRRAGVMLQPGQAEVGAGPIEQGQRPRAASDVIPHPVGDFVADMDQLVRREEARQLGGADVADLDPAVLDHVSVRDFALDRPTEMVTS